MPRAASSVDRLLGTIATRSPGHTPARSPDPGTRRVPSTGPAGGKAVVSPPAGPRVDAPGAGTLLDHPAARHKRPAAAAKKPAARRESGEFARAARSRDRTAAQLLRDYMRDYLRQEQAAAHDAWFRREVRAGIEAAEAGDVVSAEEIEAEADAWRAEVRRTVAGGE